MGLGLTKGCKPMGLGLTKGCEPIEVEMARGCRCPVARIAEINTATCFLSVNKINKYRYLVKKIFRRQWRQMLFLDRSVLFMVIFKNCNFFFFQYLPKLISKLSFHSLGLT
jgi:hypothetical protein